jgi:poly-beta-1,6-N-acetyl-D-glucosamine synthase
MNSTSYVLITPVRNEQATIGTTIESVIRQTIRPKEWIIVSDQSTDRTDEIIRTYAECFQFMRLLRLAQRPKRSFASVVFATEAGIEALQTKDYDFIGLLDGDVQFAANYYEELLVRFSKNAALGLAGGIVIDYYEGRRRRSAQYLKDVAGAVQFFRRDCFESIGGLVALPEGGWDTLTCVQARMRGFKTQTFPEIQVDHLKPRNIAEGNLFQRFRQLGVREYAIGNHPFFELAKCAYRCLEYPFLLGGLLRLIGYSLCYARRKERILSEDLIKFIRHEQLSRLIPFGNLLRRVILRLR